jgi:toxin-antitoxin system PIN domain toxin
MSASIDLPDVNAWLALTDDRHVHHLAAQKYWNEQRAGEIAFCRVTMLALLRLLTNTQVMSGLPYTHEEAWNIYRTYRNLPIIHFLPEANTLETTFAALTTDYTLPHRLWTDAYLAAFAISTRSRLVSFDTDFKRFPNLDLLLLNPFERI